MNFITFILIVFAALLITWFAIYVICQSLLWLASKNIDKFLKNRNTTACQYLQTNRFCKQCKNDGRVWMAVGWGMKQLRFALVESARLEIRRNIYNSNTTMQSQCPNCIFQLSCEQKYYPRCYDCLMNKICDKWKKTNNIGICKNFLCHRRIEVD